ncbi:MAG: flippase [Paludibacteraceae bacterium]|nr:flippase [Paludibacteraceae bacterium]
MVSIGVLQVANYLIPFLVLPIISRILGASLFGSVSYAQNIVTYLTLLVNYGFEYSATRQISIAGDDKVRKDAIFWSVLLAKTLLLVFSFGILAALPFCVERVACDPRLYIYTALANIGIVLFPTWYLQGVQQMDKMAWVNFFIKLLGAVLVLSFVREASAYRLYPLLMSLASIVIGIGALVYVVRHFGISRPILSCAIFREVLSAGAPIFINNVFISLYTTINMTLLGLYVADDVIGYFSGAQRLIIALYTVCVAPVSMALYPEISRRFEVSKAEGVRSLKRVLLIAGAGSAAVSLLTYLFAPLAIRIIYGAGFAPSVEILRWLSPIPFLVMMATLLTVQGMYGLGLQKWAPYVGLVLAVVCVSMNLILLPLWGVKAVCVSWIAAQVLECVLVGGILLTKGRKVCSI